MGVLGRVGIIDYMEINRLIEPETLELKRELPSNILAKPLGHNKKRNKGFLKIVNAKYFNSP